MKGLAPIARLVVVGSLGLSPAALAAPQLPPTPEPPPSLADAATDAAAVPAEYLREEREGLRFAYHPSARDAVRPLLEQAVALRDEIRRALAADVLAAVDVRIAWGPTDLSRHGRRAAASASGRGDGTLLAIDLEPAGRAGRADAIDLFRQELGAAGLSELAAPHALPDWLSTGFGASFASKTALRERLGLGWALANDTLIPVGGLDVALRRGGEDAALGAAEAADWVAFLRAEVRSDAFADLVRRLGRGEPFGAAVQASFHTSPTELEARWRADLGRRAVFGPLLVAGLCCALVVLGLGAWWRRLLRRRARRQEELARLHQRARAEAERLVPVAVRLVQIAPGEPSLGAALHLGRREEHSDPDVPRISHDGQWHTLH